MIFHEGRKMDSATLYLIYAAALGFAGFVLLFILSMKFMILGLRVFIGKLRYGGNAGFVIFQNKRGDFYKFTVVNIGNNTYTTKDRTYILDKYMVQGGLWFGLPFALIPDNDIMTSAGIYYPVLNDDGEQEFIKDSHDNLIYDDFGDPIPKLSPTKRGAVLAPSLLTAIIKDEALTSALKDLFGKSNMILYAAAGALFASAIAAYFAYDFNANYLQDIMNLLRTAASCAATGVSG